MQLLNKFHEYWITVDDTVAEYTLQEVPIFCKNAVDDVI